jgi:hypothetical protein
MIAIILIGSLCVAIVLFAVGIIIGWFSTSAAARYQRVVGAIGNLFFQITIVAVAAAILYVVWLAATGSVP